MKTYAVIGLGKFGYHIAKGLAEQGLSVIACDNDAEKVKQIGDYVDDAVVLDSTDIKALDDAGIGKVDVVIVSIGEDIEASTLTIMSCIELGIKQVIGKAISVLHGKILIKLGASKVIHPEREAAMRLVKNIAEHITYDTIDLSNTMRIVKFAAPKVFIDHKIADIDFEHTYKVKLIAHKYNGVWHTDVDDSLTIHEHDILVLLGGVEDIEKLSKTCTDTGEK
jgi:trk system potassium uptake protein